MKYKFRCLGLESKKWHYYNEIDGRANITPDEPCSGSQQSTNLLDKNGVEVFEGDVVTYIGHKNRVIAWTPDDSHYAGWYAVKEGSRPLPISGGNEHNTIEVIGNIYQDAHLLKVDPTT